MSHVLAKVVKFTVTFCCAKPMAVGHTSDLPVGAPPRCVAMDRVCPPTECTPLLLTKSLTVSEGFCSDADLGCDSRMHGSCITPSAPFFTFIAPQRSASQHDTSIQAHQAFCPTQRSLDSSRTECGWLINYHPHMHLGRAINTIWRWPTVTFAGMPGATCRVDSIGSS